MERTCNKCGETKPIEKYSICSKIVNGVKVLYRRRKCNKCTLEPYNVKRTEWARLHVEYRKKKAKEYYAKNRNKIRIKAKKRRKDHPEIMINYYKNNSDKIKRRSKEWGLKNKDKINQRKRDRLKNDILYKKRKNDIANAAITDLRDYYIINFMSENLGIKPYILRQHPELIEAKRIQIKLKRLINENSNRT